MSITNLDKEVCWYALHTIAGYEGMAKRNLENTIVKFDLQDRIFDIVIPMEDVLTERRGKKVIVSKKMMPAYLLVKMIYGDDIWHAVTKTQHITGFVGPQGRPQAITAEEVAKLRLERTSSDIIINIGDNVEILEGPLNGMSGNVKEVDKENNTVKCSVELFGRETMVDISICSIRIV